MDEKNIIEALNKILRTPNTISKDLCEYITVDYKDKEKINQLITQNNFIESN